MSYREEGDFSTVLSQDASTPIAIVGISGRFPGDATTPDKLWDMITQKRSARTDVPKNRYNIDAFYHPNADHQGSTSARGGHFLKDDVAAFDAPFFKITAQEAHAMDPQQRMALELSYEALESAGIRIEDVSGSAMGCYMACCVRDYAAIRAIDPDDYPRYEANGSMGTAMIANRVSWYFDIKGPSISLDTACSSSLVALHLACQSIRTGETKAALVGATNLILMPHTSNHLSTLSFLSPDGKSMAFDHRANGYSRGEGVSVIVVKSLADALRDGDVIRAVIRGTSVTQDGRTPGINLPSSEAQEALIRAAYTNAGVTPDQTAFFEAHGPGTPAGDPLEAAAIAAVFGKTRNSSNPLYVGSVKTNIGHLEAGAGLAGLVKAIFALERGQIPPNIWFEKANPKIDLEKWGLAVPTELLPWPTDGLRRASINSFGYGGTNAHCILDDAYHYMRERRLVGHHNTITTVLGRRIEHIPSDLVSPTDTSPTDISFVSSDSSESVSENESERGRTSSISDVTDLGECHASPQLFVWSSHEQSGIGRMASSLQSYLREQQISPINESAFMKRLAYTLSSRRSKLSWTSFIVASNVDEAVKALDIANKPMRPAQNLLALFVFTGQGAQWFGMGRELRAYRTYNNSLIQATAHLKSLGCEWDLLEELEASESESRINEPQISQPACTAVQVALVDLFREWGILPSITVGHSSGEIGAAYAKGAISRESAWTIAYHRGRLSAGLSRVGAMLAVALSEEDAQGFVAKVTADPKPVVACINSPISVTLSGSVDAINEAQALIGTQAWCRKLLVKTAYHSPFMQELAQPYLESLEGIKAPKSNTNSGVRMFSSVTGEEISDEALRAPQYWVDNMVCPVKFNHAVNAILSSPEVLSKSIEMVEIGPHGALQGPIKQILSAQEPKKLDVHALSLLTRKQDAIHTTLTATGVLYQKGFPVDVTVANVLDSKEELPTQLVDLPPFAWNHNSRYWYETALSAAYRNRKLPKHDLLGVRDDFSNDGEPSWRNYLRLSEIPWLRHYLVHDKPILSFSGVLAMLIEAVRQTAEPVKTIEAFQLRDVFPGAPLFLSESDDSPVETKLQLRPWRLASRSLTTYWKEFSLSSRNRQGDWTQHSTGLIKLKYAAEERLSGFTDEDVATAESYRAEYSRISSLPLKERSTAKFYEKFSALGMQWGPTYQSLADSRTGGSIICSTVQIPDTKSLMPKNVESRHIIHPAALDSAFQMLMACDGVNKPTVPKYIERIQISAKIPTQEGARLHGFADIKERCFDGTNGTVVISDEKWEEPLIIFEGLKSTDFATDTEAQKDEQAQLKALHKLGAYPTWDIDVENSTDATAELLGKTCAKARQTDYSVVYDLEWAAYIVCKRATKKFSPEDAEKMAPHYRIYYNYMKRQCELAEAGKLPCQSPEWTSASEVIEEGVLARVAEASLEGEMMYRINENISSMLLGKVEAWEVMSRDNLLNNMYRYGLSDERTPTVQCEYIKHLSHKRPLRILEVGAGTGSATSRILKSLEPNVAGRLQKYTYTDISGVFFEAASEEFKDWSSMMEFKVLDIEKDPSQQGLEEGSYDLVVAFQVLHATSSIGTTLAHCRKLLKPGGHLIVTELTNKIARRSVVFGVLSGWWLGEDDGRKWGPELSEEEWDSRLREQGFSGVDWCFRDREDVGHSSSIMASSVPYAPSDNLPTKVVIVTSPAENPQTKPIVEQLSSRLALGGTFVRHSTLLDLTKTNLSGTRCIAVMEVDRPLLSSIKAEEYDALKNMVLNSEGTLWLTRGGTSIDTRQPELNMVAGFARTIRGEAPHVAFTTLDLDPDVPCERTEVADIILKVLRLQEEPHNTDHEFAQRKGTLHVLRISPDESLSRLMKPEESHGDHLTIQPLKQADRPLKLDLKATGELDSFYFSDDTEYAKPLGDQEIEIEVKAVGLDPYDMAIAVGQLWDPNLGVECSGVVSRLGKDVTGFSVGNRVMTCAMGWYKTFIRNTQDMFQKLPDTMSFEEGATTMISYGTAVHSIFNVARLQAGETILIHSASDVLGQAAINAAQHVGAEILATVSSEAEKRFLIEHHHIPEDHIFSNKDVGFVQGVKRITNGLGVQVVLNSLTGELLRQTWHCIAPFGRFIELGMKDIKSNTGLDMVPFASNAIFAGVNILTMYRTNRPLFSRLMADVFRYFQEGVVKLVTPLHIFKFSEIAEAFRMLQARKHGGKVVLQVVDDDNVPVTTSRKVELRLRPDATYIIPGGMGGLGRSLMRWMAAKGARNLVATSRSGAKDPRAQQLLEDLTKLGVKVKAFAADVGCMEQCESVLEEIKKDGFPPVKGAVIMAMNVQDSMFETMGFDAWWAALRPKYKVTWNMHHTLPKDLDFFICMSSAAGQIGSIAQSNYNAGNTYQDAVAHYRRAQGLKATSINLGWMGEIGFVSEQGKVPEIVRAGAPQLTEAQFLAVVEAAMAGQVGAQPVLGLASGGLVRANGDDDPYWFSDARFGPLSVYDTQTQHIGSQSRAKSNTAADMATILGATASMDDAKAAVCSALMAKLAKGLMMELEDLDSARPINTYGVDSLVAVDIRAWALKELQSVVHVSEILRNVPMIDLAGHIASKSKLLPATLLEGAAAQA